MKITPILSITEEIARQAIWLRQQRKLSLGDALVASTALIHTLPLVTHSITDFHWISEPELLDPLAS